MFNDDLERRALASATDVTGAAERTLEVLAVGFIWSLGGAVLGLLAAVLASAFLESTVPVGGLGLLGIFVGALAGLSLETAK